MRQGDAEVIGFDGDDALAAGTVGFCA